jgi:hypothetical protein
MSIATHGKGSIKPSDFLPQHIPDATADAERAGRQDPRRHESDVGRAQTENLIQWDKSHPSTLA